MPQRGDQDAI